MKYMNFFGACCAWMILLLLAVAFSDGQALAADQAGGEWPLLLAGGFVNIRGLFSREAIIKYLVSLGPVYTVVQDTIFKNRPQQPGPLIGEDIIRAVAKAMPLGRRGSRSITVPGGTGASNFYEPFPIHPDISVTGADLNNLKLYQANADSLGIWAQNKTSYLRDIVRATTEAMCAVALCGRLQWPVQLEGGGFETYDIDYGTIQSVVPSKLLDAVDVKTADVFELLTEMQLKLQLQGFGGTIEIWAGKAAYSALYKICEKSVTTAKINIQITDQGINIGGFLIKRRAELYFNPQSKTYIPTVGDKVIKMIATDAGHIMPYAAIDDLDGNLEPMPFFIKPIETKNPSGYQLVAESKPLPVVNVDGICDATVVS